MVKVALTCTPTAVGAEPVEVTLHGESVESVLEAAAVLFSLGFEGNNYGQLCLDDALLGVVVSKA